MAAEGGRCPENRQIPAPGTAGWGKSGGIALSLERGLLLYVLRFPSSSLPETLNKQKQNQNQAIFVCIIYR